MTTIVWLLILSLESYISSRIWGKSSACVMIAAGKCDSRTGPSKVEDESVSEVIEWEAKARSLMMNSIEKSIIAQGGRNI